MFSVLIYARLSVSIVRISHSAVQHLESNASDDEARQLIAQSLGTKGFNTLQYPTCC